MYQLKKTCEAVRFYYKRIANYAKLGRNLMIFSKRSSFSKDYESGILSVKHNILTEYGITQFLIAIGVTCICKTSCCLGVCFVYY